MSWQAILTLILIPFCLVNCSSVPAIDHEYVRSVEDAELCHQQLTALQNNIALGLQFADAGARIPKGILRGNLVDLGSYHQCLAIDELVDETRVQGKFCSIRVPVDQTFKLPDFGVQPEWSSFNPTSLNLNGDLIRKIEEYNSKQKFSNIEVLDYYNNSRTIDNNPLSGAAFTLGICVPKACTTQEAINTILFNVSAIGFQYTDNYCRIPGDKPWSGADTAALVVFSVIGLLTLLSTCYDLCYRFILRRDIKQVNTVYQSCSIYTNVQTLMTFKTTASSLTCLDGMRAISLCWIILGHSFATEPNIADPLSSIEWRFTARSLWLSLATSGVDTFFTLGGILLVYTTAGKMNGQTLLKNLHWFYLARLVRLMPLMAVAVLLQASLFNHIADGPNWQTPEALTNWCRDNWWSTLLNIQNFIHTTDMCVVHSWYVAIDIHIYILSPLVLYWVLGKKSRDAWLALCGSLLLVLAIATPYIFSQKLQGATTVPGRPPTEQQRYMSRYYLNTLCRASPFFVGLIFGYILHIHRKSKILFTHATGIFLWGASGAIVAGICYFEYSITQMEWDNQFVDSFMNSFMRPAWAVAIGIVVLTCVHGYAAPVDWFLSLNIWQVPARLSYGMYLFHYPAMFSINATATTPVYFDVGLFTFKFLAHLVLSLAMSLVLTALVDSPIATLYRLMMKSVQKKKASPIENKSIKEDIKSKDVPVLKEVTEVKDKSEVIDIADNKETAITIK